MVTLAKDKAVARYFRAQCGWAHSKSSMDPGLIGSGASLDLGPRPGIEEAAEARTRRWAFSRFCKKVDLITDPDGSIF